MFELSREPWWRVGLAMFAVGWGAQQFAPMLLVYHARLGTSRGTLGALFGVYALGLIPGLLVGGRTSDRRGRRPLVRLFVLLSPVATLILMAGRHSIELLALGRLLAGLCSGVVFGVGSAWVQDLSTEGRAARRATVALSAGFGAGPLVAGALAQWAPGPLVIPYLPHLLLALVALLVVWNTTETAPGAARKARRSTPIVPEAVRLSRFRGVVVPLAPWVFAFAAISCVVLPTQLTHAGRQAVFFDGLANALTLGTGVLVQPWARRVEDLRPLSATTAGFGLGLVGLGVAVVLVLLRSAPMVLVAAVLFGAAYGSVMVSGLRETERLAAPAERGVTVAIYLALTYIGFATPLLVTFLATRMGAVAALLVLAVAAAGSLGIVRRCDQA